MKIESYVPQVLVAVMIVTNIFMLNASQFTPPPVPPKPAIIPEDEPVDIPLNIQLTSPKGSSNRFHARRPASLDKASRLLGIEANPTPPSAKASKILGTSLLEESEEKRGASQTLGVGAHRRMPRSSAPLLFTNSDAAIRLMNDINTGNLENVKGAMRYETVNINEPVAEFDGQTPFERAIDLDQKEIAEYMIYHGADLTRKNRFNQTPTEMALDLNRDTIAFYCIESLPFGELDKKDMSGKPLLVRTAERGNSDLVELLVKRGALVRMTDSTGATPLIAAARAGKKDVVKKLLYYLSPLDAQDKRGFTALMWAALENHGDVVTILKKAGANETLEAYNAKVIADELLTENSLLPADKQRSEREIQAEASRISHLTYHDIKKMTGSMNTRRGNSLQWITQFMNRKKSNSNAQDFTTVFAEPSEAEKHSPISPGSPDQGQCVQAISGKAARILGEEFISTLPPLGRMSSSSSRSSPGSPQIVPDNDSNSPTPRKISLLSSQGVSEQPQWTVRKPSDPHKAREEAVSLMKAIDDTNKNKVKKILESALVDVNEPVADYQESPFYRAIQQNKTDIAKMMLNFGARFDEKNVFTDKTPLDLVIELYNRQDIAIPMIEQLLKEQRIHINDTNEFGETLLYRAVDHENDVLVKWLLKKGANPDIADSEGRTPLMVATKNCMQSIIERLLKCKPHIDQQDKYGWTALMWASVNNQGLCARLLMEAGAQPTIKSKDKKAIVEMLMEENETLPQGQKLSDNTIEQTAELYGNKSFLVLNEAFHDRKSIISAVAKSLK